MQLLPDTGYVRLAQIVGKPATSTAPAVPPIIPVSRSTWWAGVKAGRFPRPVHGLGPRITAWRAEDIRALLEQVNQASAKASARDG
jgi:prophage regulatory protein